MGFGLQRGPQVASQAGWFMRIKRAIADHGGLAIRGAANADASARRCDACSGVIAASVCCLASRSPCTGFRRSGGDLRYSPRSITVYAHKRRAWIARWIDVRRASGILRCCIPSRGVPLTTDDQKHLLPRYDRAPRFPRRAYAHKLSSSQLRRPPPSNDKAVHAARATTRYPRRRRHTRRHRVAHRPLGHPPHHPIESSAIVASFMRINR